MEHRIIRSDGTVRWVSFHSQTFFEGDGAIRGLVRTIGAAVDVTDKTVAEEKQRQLISELDHRVKNVLARMSAVIERSRGRNNSIDNFSKALEGRIQSMAAAHSLLSQSRWRGADKAPKAGSGAEGLTNKQIAQELSIAESTVKRHVANILRLFGAHNRAQAPRSACFPQLGMISFEEQVWSAWPTSAAMILWSKSALQSRRPAAHFL